MKTDTPETDEKTYWNSLPQMATSAQIVHADLCREMERERDDALRLIAEIKDLSSHSWDEGDSIYIKCEKFLKENRPMGLYRDFYEPDPKDFDEDEWDSDGKHTTCNRCGEDIFLAQDPEDGKWKPYVSETSDDKHSCKKPASNFFTKLA